MLIVNTSIYPEHVSCHAVNLDKQEARPRDTAIQQAETDSLNQLQYKRYLPHRPHQIARLAQRATRRRVITCTTPRKNWPHPQPGRVNKGVAKYLTTSQVCSIDKLSFVPRCVPHMRSLSILGSTPDRDRCAAAPLDVRRRFTMACLCVHDTHAAGTTYTWWWLCALLLGHSSSRPSCRTLGIEERIILQGRGATCLRLVELAW